MYKKTNASIVKKIVLATILVGSSILQATDVVHYDIRDEKPAQVSKPNYPNNDIHVNK